MLQIWIRKKKTMSIKWNSDENRSKSPHSDGCEEMAVLATCVFENTSVKAPLPRWSMMITDCPLWGLRWGCLNVCAAHQFNWGTAGGCHVSRRHSFRGFCSSQIQQPKSYFPWSSLSHRDSLCLKDEPMK